MADGLNNVRAMRVGEIMNDYKITMNAIASIRTNPTPQEYNEEGYVALRSCCSAAQDLLARPFVSTTGPTNDPDHIKANLGRIILDASTRRFKAKKLYYQAQVALRYIAARSTIGGVPPAQQAAMIEQLRMNMRREMATVTDAQVFASIRQADVNDGKWLSEDPPLSIIQHVIQSGI